MCWGLLVRAKCSTQRYPALCIIDPFLIVISPLFIKAHDQKTTKKHLWSLNTTEHVCYNWTISRLIFLRLQDFITDKISIKVILSESLILFYVCNQPASYKTFISETTSVFRVFILEQKMLLDISNLVLARKTAFVHFFSESIFSEVNNLIKTKFSFFPAQSCGGTSGVNVQSTFA